jgi:adenylate cyclase
MAGESLPAWVHPYEAGLAAYEDRSWNEAIALFEQTIALRGTDQPADIMIARCRELLANPPSADWQPVVALQSK